MSDKTQASIAIVSIKVNGADVADVERDVEEIVIDTTYNLPSMASIRLYDDSWRWIEGTTFKLGAKIVIMMAPAKSMLKVTPGEVFNGEIVALEPNFSSQGTDTLTIRAYDLSHRLHIGTKERTFLKMSDADIVSKIAQENGLQKGSVAAGGTKYDYVVQNNLTDYEFLAARAQRSGCMLSIVKGKINFNKPTTMTAGPTIVMGETLRSFSLRMSAARQAQEVVVRGWDYKAKKALVARSTPKQLWNKPTISTAGGAAAKSAFGMNGKTTLTSFVPENATDAQAIADAAAGDQEGHHIEADGVSYGHPSLLAGVQIELKELGKDYVGKYFVTSATHIFNSAGYETHFTVSGRYPQTFAQLLNGRSVGSVYDPGSVFGVVVGIVTNVKDPDNLGRVKVKFPWLGEGATEVESHWARIAAPSAGNNRGFLFLPELNDEVLLVFEHGNMNHPYIVGTLWNGKDKPPTTNAAAHTGEGTILRMIVTRSGHKVIFDDSNSKKSVTIIDATEKQSIFFDSVKNAVEIKSGGNMLIEVKGNLDIKVDGNMTTEAKMNYKVTGMNVEIAASSGYVKLDAKTMMDLKAVSAVTLESSTSPTQIKGTLVDISATGNVVVKGIMIMLN